ncbi:D-alanyl-lipoteichoic acid biosynthesis protein DltB [Bacillus sp. AFS076308]|uniref:D-alanyl-lipoteichoic acid biosynthesis protein DltB n=1 Tax=unclassified Bacillus (in: firmicutes) TaxID=185979 RepID=UPI000BF37321|nr:MULTISPECIES: D-alanyl-lipoteichoic acid biosynthesis protein DltB [unclassified Bacillus (in: firmicutes)]PFN99448.1 D-alanyl-lipoteichoic acid biosynthesis protein DltB [Bacillus sp. AFS076308]PGV55842.1 D-alanyl-lipoteichoic acid biosynthesis protein DltB [Bacillus sp. AFS037270]
MIPYSSFTFFFILVILLAPTIILGLQGKRFQSYNMVVTVIVLAIIFSSKPASALALVLFTSWQVLLIEGYIAYRKKANNGWIFSFAVIASILPLTIYKLLPYFSDTNWMSFLGISYLTFKGTQLIMETRDGLIKQRLPLASLLYFILFFPTISSGPIDRYRRFDKDLKAEVTAEQYKQLLYDGINKIFLGFLYKYIIGYSINHFFIPNLRFIATSHFQSQLFYMYGYSFYLFFDFAGYSAFAIGVSYIMGIKSPENFNLPFISRNIKDFWNRWHMSLSFWFRDYVYMRFVFWMTKKKWIKNRNITSNLGYILLFLLMGFWHGLEIQYILYGVYHALLMVGYNTFEQFNKKHKWWPQTRFTRVVSILITFHFICFGFYIFSGHFIQRGA